MEGDQHIFVSPDVAPVDAQEDAPREVPFSHCPTLALAYTASGRIFSLLFFGSQSKAPFFLAHRQGTTGPCEPTSADAKPAKPFWHFTEHLKWGATAEGQRQLAKYPQVKPRSKEEEEQHQAFGRRIMARYGAPE
ncbi:hypothetical protein [Pandoravirus japonicus]|uniref:Uncharacterized protein n=1 Tax=Pandoravirus japonicus TaxID=2823154 RepID=A0A811BQH5_9VIRU|nr:hypothetical protein [Pandoravirus japonicus]